MFVITSQEIIFDCYKNSLKNKNIAITGFANLLINNSLVTVVTSLTA